MNTLTGNNILIVDNDALYVERITNDLIDRGATTYGVCLMSDAKKILQKKDIEFVVCNYYLSDGLILQLIDWCKINLETLPVFISLGVPTPTEMAIHHRHLIAESYEKLAKIEDLIQIISKHAFNEAEFRDTILSLTENRGIYIELIAAGEKYSARPLEIVENGLYISSTVHLKGDSCAILRLSIYEGDSFVNFSVLGHLIEEDATGQMFLILDGYKLNWSKLLKMLENKQIKTNSFLKKVSGY